MDSAEDLNKQDAPTIMERLRAETRLAHDTIEQTTPITKLLEGNGTKEDYINVLKSSLSYYRPLERRIEESGQEEIIAFMQGRFKAELIEKDLKRLGVEAEEIAAIPDYNIPPIDTPEQMLGALYVFEGSTLGGKVITKELKDHYDWALDGKHFLDPYGKEVRKKWEAYSVFAEQQVVDNKLDADAIVQSAQAAFTTYNECLANNVHLGAEKSESEVGDDTSFAGSVKQRPQRTWKQKVALIAAGTMGSAALGGAVGATGGAGAKWVNQKFFASAELDPSAQTSEQDKDKDSGMLQDAMIGAAVFGAYGLKGSIMLAFGLSVWNKLRGRNDDDPKCPLGFDKMAR